MSGREHRHPDECRFCGRPSNQEHADDCPNNPAQLVERAKKDRREFEERQRKLRESPPRHTVNGETSETGWPYGTTHDMDCPACVASGEPFTLSPRSETYWSS